MHRATRSDLPIQEFASHRQREVERAPGGGFLREREVKLAGDVVPGSVTHDAGDGGGVQREAGEAKEAEEAKEFAEFRVSIFEFRHVHTFPASWLAVPKFTLAPLIL